jgi:hypothetical protein
MCVDQNVLQRMACSPSRMVEAGHRHNSNGMGTFRAHLIEQSKLWSGVTTESISGAPRLCQFAKCVFGNRTNETLDEQFRRITTEIGGAARLAFSALEAMPRFGCPASHREAYQPLRNGVTDVVLKTLLHVQLPWPAWIDSVTGEKLLPKPRPASGIDNLSREPVVGEMRSREAERGSNATTTARLLYGEGTGKNKAQFGSSSIAVLWHGPEVIHRYMSVSGTPPRWEHTSQTGSSCTCSASNTDPKPEILPSWLTQQPDDPPDSYRVPGNDSSPFFVTWAVDRPGEAYYHGDEVCPRDPYWMFCSVASTDVVPTCELDLGCRLVIKPQRLCLMITWEVP